MGDLAWEGVDSGQQHGGVRGGKAVALELEATRGAQERVSAGCPGGGSRDGGAAGRAAEVGACDLGSIGASLWGRLLFGEVRSREVKSDADFQFNVFKHTIPVTLFPQKSLYVTTCVLPPFS